MANKNNKAGFFSSVFAGMGIIFFFALISGTIEILLAIIICTLGVVLLPLLPVCYVIGRITLYFFGLIGSYLNGPESNSSNLASTDRSERAIVRYIQQCREHSASDDEIRKLLAKDWDADSIDHAFDFLAKKDS